jgi:hypothetical protein
LFRPFGFACMCRFHAHIVATVLQICNRSCGKIAVLELKITLTACLKDVLKWSQ